MSAQQENPPKQEDPAIRKAYDQELEDLVLWCQGQQETINDTIDNEEMRDIVLVSLETRYLMKIRELNEQYEEDLGTFRSRLEWYGGKKKYIAEKEVREKREKEKELEKEKQLEAQ